eukprot:5913-Heterococcus_DN1.PRE.2
MGVSNVSQQCLLHREAWTNRSAGTAVVTKPAAWGLSRRKEGAQTVCRLCDSTGALAIMGLAAACTGDKLRCRWGHQL